MITDFSDILKQILIMLFLLFFVSDLLRVFPPYILVPANGVAEPVKSLLPGRKLVAPYTYAHKKILV